MLRYKEKKSLKEISAITSLCQERVRMVITQSLCTLRCDHTVNLILNGAEDKPMDLFETPIGQVFPDSMRIYRCMMRAGIFTLGDLIGKTENDLTSIRNFGETTLREVKDTLNQYGLKLKEKKA